MNDFRIGRSYGAKNLFGLGTTKMSLLTELEMGGNMPGPSLYHLLEVLGEREGVAAD